VYPPNGDEEIENLLSLVDVDFDQLPSLSWLEESTAVALPNQSFFDHEVMVRKEPKLYA